MRKGDLEHVDMAKYARREAFVLRRLDHPNIVHLVEAVQSETKLFLVMDIAPGSELLRLVSQGPLSEHIACVYIRQLVSAVGYLHRKGIAHRDLKPENVIADHVTCSLRLIDFGLTGVVRRNDVMRTICGSAFYSAPEVTYNDGRGYDGTAADCWSVGVLSYILLCGVHPFVAPDGELMVSALCDGHLQFPPGLSESAAHMLRRLLDVDPSKRYSMARTSLHPWLSAEHRSAGWNERTKRASFRADSGSFTPIEQNEARVGRMQAPNDPYFSADSSSRVDSDIEGDFQRRGIRGSRDSSDFESNSRALPRPTYTRPHAGLQVTSLQPEKTQSDQIQPSDPCSGSRDQPRQVFVRSSSERISASAASLSAQIDEYGEELAMDSVQLHQPFNSRNGRLERTPAPGREVSTTGSVSSSVTSSPRLRLHRTSFSVRPGRSAQGPALVQPHAGTGVASDSLGRQEDGEMSTGFVRYSAFGLGRHRFSLDAREGLPQKGNDGPKVVERSGSRRFRPGGLAGILARRRGA